MTGVAPLIAVVDDDESVRESLPDLLTQLRYGSRVFASAEEFLASDATNEVRCLLLDVAMPGMSGPVLHRELARRAMRIPIVFITAQQDESLRARLLAAGAVDCLFKPFSEATLSAALRNALRG